MSSAQEITMVTDEVGRQLHDRATRGETLSADDQARLAEWNAPQARLHWLVPPGAVALHRSKSGSIVRLWA